VDVELADFDVVVVEVEKVVGIEVEELGAAELVLLEVELGEASETEELDDKGTLDELELDCEDVLLDTALLELDTTTGLRLLYIDNRDEPPHLLDLVSVNHTSVRQGLTSSVVSALQVFEQVLPDIDGTLPALRVFPQ
jgi:hypothetical protein